MSIRLTRAARRGAAPRLSGRIHHSTLAFGVALALSAGTLQAQEANAPSADAEKAEAQATELDRIVEIFAIDQSGADEFAAPPMRRDAAPTHVSKAAPKAAKAYLSQGNAAISADWDEF